jgi:hypothetical protein
VTLVAEDSARYAPDPPGGYVASEHLDVFCSQGRISVPDQREIALPDVRLERTIAHDLGAKPKPGPKKSQSGKRDGELLSRRREQRQLGVSP